jgi:glutathione peroxidase
MKEKHYLQSLNLLVVIIHRKIGTRMSIYSLTVVNNKGEAVSLSSFKDNVILIINSATHCGYTKQYEGLENLYQLYKDKGFTILDFPSNTFFQTPENDEGISSFCAVKYKTSFPLFKKIDVNGPNTDPLYTYLKSQNETGKEEPIGWNFTKFLINRKGQVVGRYPSKTTPDDLIPIIAALL